MPLQLKIFDGDDFGFPLIKVIPPESPLYDQVDDVHLLASLHAVLFDCSAGEQR